MSVSLLQTSITPSSSNVKEAVMAAIRKFKTKPSDTTNYPRADWDRSVDLYLLTFQPEDGDIDLLLEVFMRQMQIHILGIGPVFWPGIRWGVPLSTSNPRLNGTDGRSEQMPITVEDIFY